MAYYFSPLRKEYNEKPANGCFFCDKTIIDKQAITYKSGLKFENEHYRWIINYFPRAEGHTMVIPKRHITSLDQESDQEVLSRHDITMKAAEALKKVYPGAGIEIFIQNGPGSASSVPHIHWHIVPALPTDNLRSFEKLGHFYTTEQNKQKVIIFPQKIEKARQDLQQAITQIL